MNKKNKTTLIVLILVLILVGCGTFGIISAQKHLVQKDEQITESSANEDNNEITVQDDAKPNSETSSKNSADSNSENSVSNDATSKNNTTKSTTQGRSNSSNTNENKTTAKAEQTAQSEYRCTVTIECSAILDNMDSLRKGKEIYVPSDGYILKNYTVKAKDGDTVYSLLKRACNENSIPLSAGNLGYGTYVSGINNLNEKDCGSGSGWEYKVNGKSPGHAASNEKIKKDSAILWTYVTEPYSR